jgi:hypothetical protein
VGDLRAEPVSAIVLSECKQIGQDQDTVGVVNVVSSTSVRSRQRRVLVQFPLGMMLHCPASGPSSRPNTEGESKGGKLSHTTEPERSTKAVE